MSKTRPDTVAIFGEALEKQSSEEAAEYLDTACGDDAGRRARVEALLEPHRRAGGFLGGPSSDADLTAASGIVEKPGAQVGFYKLLEEIGQGGFGVVYMAEQTAPIRRQCRYLGVSQENEAT